MGNEIMRYMVKAYKKRTRALQEGNILPTYGQAFADAQEFLKSNQYEVIVIVADDEGESHPDNAGKFFLYRIIK